MEDRGHPQRVAEHAATLTALETMLPNAAEGSAECAAS